MSGVEVSVVNWENGEPRWSDEAVEAVGGPGQVIRAAGEADWQGAGVILATGNRVLAWSYGSCSVCDPYEDAQDPVAEMRDEIQTFDTQEEALAAFNGERERLW